MEVDFPELLVYDSPYSYKARWSLLDRGTVNAYEAAQEGSADIVLEQLDSIDPNKKATIIDTLAVHTTPRNLALLLENGVGVTPSATHWASNDRRIRNLKLLLEHDIVPPAFWFEEDLMGMGRDRAAKIIERIVRSHRGRRRR